MRNQGARIPHSRQEAWGASCETECMYHIIYMSSAVRPFSQAELQKLLERARQSNTAMEVTGMLLYKDGNFLQVLEGEKKVLDQLYKKIQHDPRHRGCMVLFQEPITKREFTDWSMAFRDLNTPKDKLPEGFNDLLNRNWSDINLSEFSGKVRAFLKMFAP